MKLSKVKILVLGLVILSLVLAGCSSNNAANTSTEKPEEFFVKIATGNTGGTYYPIGVAFGKVLSDKVPGCVSSAMATGGSVDNVNMLRSGEVQIAMIMSTVADWAYKGEQNFSGKSFPEMRAISSLWSNQMQVIVSKDIQKFEDLKGKKFVVGAVGSGTETDSYALLSSFGLYYRDSDKEKKNMTALYVNYTEGVDALKNKQAAGMLNVSNPPASAVTDLLSTGDFHLLSLTEEEVKELCEVNPLYTNYTIKAGTYPNMPQDVIVAGYPVILLVKEDMPADQVYEITKALFEYRQDLITAHKAAEEITLENVAKGVSIPFHEGAKKYLVEKGALK